MRRRERRLRRTRSPNHLGGRGQCGGKIVQGGALRLIQLYRLLNLLDGEAGDFAAVIAAELLERRDSAMSSAGRARSCIGGEIIMAVRCKDSGIDVGITIVPEAGAITPNGVVVDIVNGEWPKQRSNPPKSTVAVSPPTVRD